MRPPQFPRNLSGIKARDHFGAALTAGNFGRHDAEWRPLTGGARAFCYRGGGQSPGISSAGAAPVRKRRVIPQERRRYQSLGKSCPSASRVSQ